MNKRAEKRRASRLNEDKSIPVDNGTEKSVALLERKVVALMQNVQQLTKANKFANDRIRRLENRVGLVEGLVRRMQPIVAHISRVIR